jgi:hypothetical protein
MLSMLTVSCTEVHWPLIPRLKVNLITGINTRCIGLGSRDQLSQSKVIKLGKVGYHTRLLDFHRSNPFSPNLPVANGDNSLPEAW